MSDWNRFWELVNEAIPNDVILRDDNVFGDYLDGQYVVQRANQICQECGLSWHIDWDPVRVRYTTNPSTTFIKEMTGDLVVTDGEHEERRPACGLGTAFSQEGVKAKQIDTACKGALTDLIKNGWMRFGRRLGGQLYFGKSPHLATALGWEVSGDRAPRRSTSDVAPSEPSDLDSYTIHPGGWGKENKFGGMSLAELYEDPDGYGAMSWAAGCDVPKGATAKMAQYFKMREQQPEPEGVLDGTSLEEFDESVTHDNTVILFGKRIARYKQVFGGAVALQINNLIQANIGEGKLFGHAKHVVGHLKYHFSVAKVMDLTGEKAAALVHYIETGGKDRDPRWYTRGEEEAVAAIIPVPTVHEPATLPSGEAIAKNMEELFGPESVADLLKKAAPNLPEAWRDKPERWWADLCEQFRIGIINAKQLETVRFLLEAVANGNLSLEDPESATYKVFVNGMRQVSGDA